MLLLRNVYFGLGLVVALVEYAFRRGLDVVGVVGGLRASDMGAVTKMRFGADESGVADGPVLGTRAVLIVAMALVVASAAAPSRAGGDVEAEPVRTGKERLGGKASDEQRVDNCKVPPDLRGPKPRPDQCSEVTGAKR